MRDEVVRTTFVEFEIVGLLARHPGRVFTREALLERIWGDSAYRDPRTIDVHIRHLREKLERDAKEPDYIFTVRGVGYRFRDRDGRAVSVRRGARARHGTAGRSASRGTADALRSIRTRLALIFFLMTLLGVAVIYVVVAPPLTSGLQNEGVTHLQRARRTRAQGSSPQLTRRIYDLPTELRDPKARAKAQAYASRLAAGDRGSQVTIVVRAGHRHTAPPRPRRRRSPGTRTPL